PYTTLCLSLRQRPRLVAARPVGGLPGFLPGPRASAGAPPLSPRPGLRPRLPASLVRGARRARRRRPPATRRADLPARRRRHPGARLDGGGAPRPGLRRGAGAARRGADAARAARAAVRGARAGRPRRLVAPRSGRARGVPAHRRLPPARPRDEDAALPVARLLPPPPRPA